MISKLSWYLGQISNHEIGTDDDAIDVLDFLENLGMMPPFSYDIFYKQWQIERNNAVNGNEWEPEDE